MAVYRVRGVTRWGDRISVRFEAPSASNVRALLAAEQVLVESVRQAPLSRWPFSMTRFPWLIFLFPVAGYALCSLTVLVVHAAMDLNFRRELAMLLAGAVFSAWILYNFLLRMGSHFELSRSSPRIVLITRGDNPLAGPDDEDELERGDGGSSP